ncbi:hypothetical protein FQR65_LT03831 [Abscondita terminalis]|nr:hypothetical protein FQR65_LT03831 [Abscondita terminalis]
MRHDACVSACYVPIGFQLNVDYFRSHTYCSSTRPIFFFRRSCSSINCFQSKTGHENKLRKLKKKIVDIKERERRNKVKDDQECMA